MVFKEYVDKLMPVIGGGVSQAVFARTLFEHITDFSNNPKFDEVDNPIRSMLLPSFKMYVIGKRNIGELSSKISPYLDSTIFNLYLQGFGDETAFALVEVFKDEFPEIDQSNVADVLTKAFLNIIRTAAKEKGKRKRFPRENREIFADTSDDILQINESLSQIVNALTMQKGIRKKQIELKMQTVCVPKKIVGNAFLCDTITHYAVIYYKTIRSLFKELSKSKGVDFDDVATAVKLEYKKLKKRGLSQNDIFNAMVQWVCSKTNSTDVTASSVIVSFFVQDCEVFDVVAK